MDKYSDIMNIMYSSDDNYVQHMGVSIYSLLQNNKKFEKINLFVIDNNISNENKSRLHVLVNEFKNATIVFIPFEKWKQKLKLNMEWNISLSSYARLFVSSMLPKDIKRVIYLDCDMIICDDLNEVWNLDLKGNILGAVQDSVPKATKLAVGLLEDEKYFNAGMLLIDLDSWRLLDMENKCLNYIQEHSGNVIHHDQGVLNGLCHNQVEIIPIKNNLMTIHYVYNREQVLNYSEEGSTYYSALEIKKAKENPTIIHYTPSFTCRPWVKGCKHPKKDLYWKYLNKTPWKGANLEKNSTKWYIRLIEWKYRIFPPKTKETH